MSQLLNWGRRLSRDCFLCFGGAMVLIAIGGLAGNLPDLVRFGGWPASDVRDLYFTTSFFAVSGIIFLVVAYGLFERKLWAVYLTAVVSALSVSVVLFAVVTWPEPDEWQVQVLYGIPFSCTLIWSLAEVARQLKRKALTDANGQGNPIS